ncbi:MAG TPA: gluconate 2-dehydrogenase subunit 3 family protein [Candidatus Acidoferrum sp.]|nr:gluconate 2-dehydrogenase subunit 3 family protein [Candidatus Acidoferrum sp.]
MGSEKNLVVIESATTEGVRLTRRVIVQRLLAGMGAGVAWPLAASAHPVFELLKSDAALHNEAFWDRAEQLGQANWKPAFLTSQQNELLSALAESIVPGSARVHVSRFIDLLLSVDKPENQRKILESLAAVNAEAQKRLKKSFPVLNQEQKNTFLSDASTKPKNPEAAQTEAEKKQSSLYSHFEYLKRWISGAYYSSEAGMRELGWTGDYAFAAFPGCTHPEGHH